MKRWLLLLVLLTLTACGPAPAPQDAFPVVLTVTQSRDAATPQVVLATPTMEPTSMLPQPTQPPEAATSLALPTETSLPIIIIVDTPVPTATAALPVTTDTPVAAVPPTETLLPPLDLPTLMAVEPVRVPWVGMPTYLADSLPGLMVRLDYDPEVWAETDGNYGERVLAHRTIPYCVISPWSGRGLPADWKVDHDFRQIGSYYFDVNSVSQDGVLKFVAYVGGDSKVMTGFQVSFVDNPEGCIADAEKLLLSFRPIVATPTATPSLTPVP